MKSQVVKFRHFLIDGLLDLGVTVTAKISHENEMASCELLAIQDEFGDSVSFERLRSMDKNIQRELIQEAFDEFSRQEIVEENRKLFGSAV